MPLEVSLLAMAVVSGLVALGGMLAGAGLYRAGYRQGVEAGKLQEYMSFLELYGKPDTRYGQREHDTQEGRR